MRSGAAKIRIGGAEVGNDLLEKNRKLIESMLPGSTVAKSRPTQQIYDIMLPASSYSIPQQPYTGGGRFVFDRKVETFADFKNRVNIAAEMGQITRGDAKRILDGVEVPFDDDETRRKQWDLYEVQYADAKKSSITPKIATQRFVDWWRCDNKTGSKAAESMNLPRLTCYARNFLIITGAVAGWFVLMSVTKID